jgi:murein hydrolase activator
MKQYSSYRKMQGEEINSKSKKLENYNSQLNIQKTAKQKLIAEQDKQKKGLEKDKQEQERIANSLKKSKKQVVAEIKKKQQESRKVDAQIQKMIREAIAEANRKAAAARAKANPKKTTAAETKAIENSSKVVLTPEGQLVSNNFKANKGKLPWPVDNGAITLGYGRHIDPVYKLESNNSGVEITAQTGSSVRAVFSGEVTQVMVIGQKKGIVIKHGDYFTTYLNLTNISVSTGDKVSAKEVIGKIKTNSDGDTVLKFMIFQNTTDVNPAQWLNR